MFYSVSHAGHLLLVAEVADIDVEGGAGLVCFRIVDQQGFQLVGQPDNTIGPVVERRSLELVCHPFD